MKRIWIYCLCVLSLMAVGCQAPSAEPTSTPEAAATSAPPPETSATPVYEEEVVSKGEGDSVADKGAVEVTVKVWQDKFDGTPFGQGTLKHIVVMESPELPGLGRLAKGIKKGGVRRAKLNAGELLGKIPPGAPFKADKLFYVEMTAVKVFPPEELVIKTVKEGKGRGVKTGDLVEVHYTGWTDGFNGKKQFDSSRERAPFVFPVGMNRVIPGWEKGVMGMKPGEIRRLEVPHFLAYGEKEQAWMRDRLREFCRDVLDLPDPRYTEHLRVHEWPTDWSTFFDAGKDWWGTFCWSVEHLEGGWITVIGASSTD